MRAARELGLGSGCGPARGRGAHHDSGSACFLLSGVGIVDAWYECMDGLWWPYVLFGRRRLQFGSLTVTLVSASSYGRIIQLVFIYSAVTTGHESSKCSECITFSTQYLRMRGMFPVRLTRVEVSPATIVARSMSPKSKGCIRLLPQRIERRQRVLAVVVACRLSPGHWSIESAVVS
ncbi:hypothetical protein DENSPDRAFT_323840 [Dentipellis sp. KUC8613]|nr:hypothetical protein DENSPDRAFT_323840 [Dentipellis sp. KUC8613]